MPSVALLRGDFGVCGGAIISKRVIATAAHCTLSEVYNLRVELFNESRDDKKPLYSTASYELRKVVHPDYETFSKTPGWKLSEADIAVIGLPFDITLIPGLVETVSLASSDPTVGSWLLQCGYGRTQYQGNDSRLIHFFVFS